MTNEVMGSKLVHLYRVYVPKLTIVCFNIVIVEFLNSTLVTKSNNTAACMRVI